MRIIKVKVKIWRWLEKAQAWYSKYEDSSRVEIMGDIDVCDKGLGDGKSAEHRR